MHVYCLYVVMLVHTLRQHLIFKYKNIFACCPKCAGIRPLLNSHVDISLDKIKACHVQLFSCKLCICLFFFSRLDLLVFPMNKHNLMCLGGALNLFESIS